MLRIILFLSTNLAILVLLGIVLSIFGIDSRSTSGLLVIATLFGMGGSFLSLVLSKWIAKKSTGAQIIVNPNTPKESWLYDTAARMAREVEIGMPEVAIYNSPDMNAFATGMKKNNALIAVFSGVIRHLKTESQPCGTSSC